MCLVPRRVPMPPLTEVVLLLWLRSRLKVSRAVASWGGVMLL